MGPKKNLEQHLDSGNLDLSMLDIQDVPVNGIAALSTKVKNVDLSCNNIVSLPKKFASSLTHLVKLDLSKNRITSLPDNFGLLVHLKHLDLYSNNLEFLPLSFANLKSLRWLDVKKNPLKPKLVEIAGQCQDERQCKDAAKNVVAAFLSMQNQVDEEIAKRKEEYHRTLEQQENTKTQNPEITQPKKKKKKTKNNVINSLQLNEKVDSEKCVEGLTNEQPNINTEPSVPSKKTHQHSLIMKVGILLGTLVRVVFMSALLIIFCGFILSLIDENLYNSFQKRGSLLLRTNIPKEYLKQWNSIVLQSKRVTARWWGQAVTVSSVWLGQAQQYLTTVGRDQVVQQYLESMQSSWQILWIYASDAYTALSYQLASLTNTTNMHT